jgi:hypothetical protein
MSPRLGSSNFVVTDAAEDLVGEVVELEALTRAERLDLRGSICSVAQRTLALSRH